MINYVFDVDGTLTPSRGKMSEDFQKFFYNWVRNKRVFLLTGSDAPKTIEQIGEDIWGTVISYQCAGNEIFCYGEKVYGLDWPAGESEFTLEDYLDEVLDNDPYPERCGAHVEYRKGLINFSVVGRNCSQSTREHYFEWDSNRKFREKYAKQIEILCPHLEASVGGEISIDIYPKGKNKGQVYDFLKDSGPIYFFGDKTQPGGNDYPLAKRLQEPHKVFQVSGPEETWEILKTL